MTTTLPTTVIITKDQLLIMIGKYEDHGYQVKCLKPLENDVNIYVVHFFRRMTQN